MNRRNILKAVAAAGALSAVPAHSSGIKKIQGKKKLVVLGTRLGYYDPFFKPSKDDLNSSKLVSMLKKHHGELTVMKNIGQPEIGHGHKNGVGILTCNKRQSNGAMTSLDQVAAEYVNQAARYKSLHLGGRGFVWNKNSREVHSEMEIGPDKIYNKLFTKVYADAELQKKVDTLKVFQKQIPSHAADDYKASLKELEEEIRIDLEWNKKSIPKVEIDTNLHLSDAHDRGYILPVEQHLDLISLALQHDRAQIVVGGTPYIDKTSTLGIEGSYHSVGHGTSSKVAGKEKDLWKIEEYLFKSIDRFLNSLKKANIFDDTIVLIIGGFNDSGKHQRSTVPTILAGGGFKHQGIIDCGDGKELFNHKLSHLYLTVLHQMGIDIGDFAGDSVNLDKLLI